MKRECILCGEGAVKLASVKDQLSSSSSSSGSAEESDGENNEGHWVP